MRRHHLAAGALTGVALLGFTSAVVAAPVSLSVAAHAQAATVLPAPTNVDGEYIAQRAVLGWDAVPGARDYVIYDSRRSSPVATTRGTSWTSVRLPLTHPTYTFSVAARDINRVEGARSLEVRLLVGEQTPVVVEPEPTKPPPPTEPPAEPDDPVAQPTRVWDYEPGGRLVPPWSEVHSLRPERQYVTTENPYPGTDASAEFTVRPGETGWNGTVGTLRSEVRDTIANSGNVTEGTEQYWAWATFFPSDFDWDERGQFLIFTQWHQTYNSGHPNVHLWSDVNENMMLDVRGGTGGRTAGDAQYVKTYRLGPIDKGEWDDIMVHFVWSSNPDVGLVEVFRDGKLVHSAHDANLYVGQSVYIKQGIYSAAKTQRVHMVRHSTLRLGDTREAVGG